MAERGRAALLSSEPINALPLSSVLGETIEMTIQAQENLHVDFMDWALRVPEPKAGRLDFERFPFQVELYRSFVLDRDGCVMKGTQVGISAWLLRWAIYWADTRGLTALYVFPKDVFLGDFSNQRIRPLIQRSEYLRSRVPMEHINNVHLRQIGLGFLNLRGSQSKDALDSVDADVLALDEYDTLNQENIPDAERRVSAPTSKGLIRRVGVPSVDDFGISKLFDKSDQRRWFVKCGSCGERQFLYFYKRENGHALDEEAEGADDGLPDVLSAYVDRTDEKIRCGHCDSEIDGELIAEGEWVPTYPDREVRGYHVHRLMVPGARLGPIIESSESESVTGRQVFWNKDLGLPHSEKEGRLSVEAIRASQSVLNYSIGPRDAGYLGDNLITMGVDVASVRDLNVRISEHYDSTRKRALWIGKCKNFDEVSALMNTFHVHLACVDHLPDGRLARALANTYPGRVYVSHFLPSTSANVLTWDDETFEAGIKRTEAIDAVYSLVRFQRNCLPLNLPEDYESQLRAAQRFDTEDDKGRRVVGYKKLGDDDYLMAEVYDLMATEVWKALRVQDDLTGEEITTLDEQLEGVQWRSEVNNPDAGGYTPGPEDEYDVGPKDW